MRRTAASRAGAVTRKAAAAAMGASGRKPLNGSSLWNVPPRCPACMMAPRTQRHGALRTLGAAWLQCRGTAAVGGTWAQCGRAAHRCRGRRSATCRPSRFACQVPMLRMLRNNVAGVTIQILYSAWWVPLGSGVEGRVLGPPGRHAARWCRARPLGCPPLLCATCHAPVRLALCLPQGIRGTVCDEFVGAQPAEEGGHGSAAVAGAAGHSP